MRSAVVERLNDLIQVAQQLAALVDVEKPEALLPCMTLVRVAVAADTAANQLIPQLEKLLACKG